ncbi:GRB10-interacting GYF protein 2 [Belonocnema kinseyi]|uniref:GRB10-interacting GYF protein 2 n=1 Tax=Belonocnema kinseyi TaxID=2817044 RepID=UPI00143DDB9E|nr:GRB10-interacting GYF protein 2 [Belonocnema kinseyi]
MDKDYYSTVYSWFDKIGIISNIRTHLRQNLVNVLKNKDLSLNGENDGQKSAKQYVHDLLVAEYLFDKNYVYALSVFASEAPLLVNFTKQVSSRNDAGDCKQRLQHDYISHTLDTLGIRSDDPEGQSIISKYSESEEPLLLCILHSLQTFSLKESRKEKKREVQEQRKPKNFREVGTLTEREVSRDEKLVRARTRLLQQKEAFDAELKDKEDKLRQQVLDVDQQLVLLQKKWVEAHDLTQMIQVKEKELNEERRVEQQKIYRRDMELSVKEKLLLKEADRLEKERNSYRQFETDLKKLQEELSKVKRDFPSTTRNMSRDMHVQTDLESYTVLIRENQELNSLVRQQQSRIEQLTLRAVRLSRQLEEVHLFKTNMFETSTPVTKVKNNAVVSESSSTEDILQDAKMRLKRLEEESSKADQNYYNYMTFS